MFAFLLLAMAAQAAPTDPFAALRDAYARRDAGLAAEIYTNEAEVEYRYEGVPKKVYVGRSAIQSSFNSLFASVDAADRLDLNFRFISKTPNAAEGYYRLRVGRKNASYGKFTVRISADGKFERDLSTSATREDFEETPGPVALAADAEDLDREYYAALTGRYRLPDGCALVVTRSVVRLFVRNSCTEEWRGLSRVSGREWTAGSFAVDPAVTSQYRFAEIADGYSPSLTFTDKGGKVQQALRQDSYTTQNVRFVSEDGTPIAGTVYLPLGKKGRRPATVMVHGSGPQDRDGFASVIAVMADAMAAEGRIVLAYDKRGSGLSGGNGDQASFETLASDARSAMRLLALRPDVEPSKIGLAGSSQAGWVIAKAIEAGAAPADVLLLGAAGSALSVRQQNLYNTDIQMRCSNIGPADRRVALDQQSAFFDFLADPKQAARLDKITNDASARKPIADWLFPKSSSVDRSDGSWFNVLAIDFDPLPVWKSYRGKTLFLFGEYDDATPTPVAIKRLRGSKIVTRTLASAQHLGLVAQSTCAAGLSEVSRFAPSFFRSLSDYARY